MRRQPSFYFLSFAFLLIGQFGALAQNGIAYPKNKKLPEVKIYDSGKIEDFHIKAQNWKKAGAIPTATFDVTYNGFSDEAKLVFAEAVNLWSYLLSSEVTIKIDASWEPLETGVLGSAGANSIRRNFKNAPLDFTWYPIVIANKLAGYDLEPDNSDIRARFSSTFDWYFGIDGKCPTYKYDLLSVIMHEIGHGLGFFGSASVDGDGILGSWGNDTNYPYIYDVFMYNKYNELLIDTLLFDNPSAGLKTQYTSNNLFFKSELSDAANGSKSASIYAPGTWNGGSSYSHLGETFNGTENSMMTYSTGSGESTHHPGPVTLAMFAEMGWVSVLFKHDKIKDIETWSEPLIVQTEIYSDSALVSGSVILHYSIDDFATDNAIEMISSDGTLFTAEIPVLVTDTVKYYIQATTILNRTYFHPSQGAVPVTTIGKTLYFAIIGADVNPPVVIHELPNNIFNFEKNLNINFGANDNLGLANPHIEYKINDGESMALQSDFIDYSNIDDVYLYESNVPVEGLQDGDTVYYRIIVQDMAQVTNTTILPELGFYKAAVHNLGALITNKLITLDEVGDENLFVDNGLSVYQQDGFTSKGLHSPHPYLEGLLFPSNNVEYSAILKSPIVLKEKNSFIRFDEIVLVEPGKTNAPYGDTYFYDYVVVEGSVDSTKTWFNFEKGYDSRISSLFRNTYNDGGNGTENMYTSHTINLLSNENIVGGDEVLIRFRLYSDYGSAGWGWAVDNVEILPDIVSGKTDMLQNTAFNVYPSPSKGDFEINITADNIINNYTVIVYNSIGKQIFYETNFAASHTVKRHVNISDKPAGVYFVSFVYDNKILSKKILVE